MVSKPDSKRVAVFQPEFLEDLSYWVVWGHWGQVFHLLTRSRHAVGASAWGLC